jgi:hypothetical protein
MDSYGLQALVQLLQTIPGLAAYVGLMTLLIFAAALATIFFGVTVGLVVMLGGLCILIVLVIINWVISLFAERSKAGFEEGMQQQIRGPATNKAAVREVRERWAKAMSELKAARLNIYSLPWYMLIGEPGGGKTTTLRQSGLEFPVGTQALSGTSGTRNCDWWFTNEAVILDTAGRWTFNETNAPDKQEWDEFLGLLKKYRRAAPINGVLVGIPADSLLGDDRPKRLEKAEKLRDKLTNLQRVLEVQFPVYFLILKSDRIMGFADFFGRLPPGEDRQLLGWSNAEQLDRPFDPRGFRDQFRGLYDRMHQWRLRLAGEVCEGGYDNFDGPVRTASVTDPVDVLYAFPEEFKAAGDGLADYVDIVFAENRFREPLFFRGFYFVSGLQQGKPIMKACSNLLRGSASGDEAAEDLGKIFTRSRSLFIHDVYRRKAFPEKGLVARSATAIQRDRAVRATFWGGGALLALGMAAALVWFVFDLRDKLGKLQEHLAEAGRVAGCDPEKKAPTREAPEVAATLLTETNAARERGLGSILVPFSDTKQVTDQVAEAQRSFFARFVLRPFLQKDDSGKWIPVETHLAKGMLAGGVSAAATGKDKDSAAAKLRDEQHELFVQGLAEYIRWWKGALEDEGYLVDKQTLKAFEKGAEQSTRLGRLVGYKGVADAIGVEERKSLGDRLATCYEALVALGEKDGATDVRPDGVKAVRSILTGQQRTPANLTAAVQHLRKYWEPPIESITGPTGVGDFPDERAKRYSEMRAAYDKLLELPRERRVPLATTDEYNAYVKEWNDRLDAFEKAYEAYQKAVDGYFNAINNNAAAKKQYVEETGPKLDDLEARINREYGIVREALRFKTNKAIEMNAVLAALEADYEHLRQMIVAKRQPTTPGFGSRRGLAMDPAAFERLARAKIPQPILDKLNAEMKGKRYVNEDVLYDALLNVLRPRENAEYSKAIVAAVKGEEGDSAGPGPGPGPGLGGNAAPPPPPKPMLEVNDAAVEKMGKDGVPPEVVKAVKEGLAGKKFEDDKAVDSALQDCLTTKQYNTQKDKIIAAVKAAVPPPPPPPPAPAAPAGQPTPSAPPAGLIRAGDEFDSKEFTAALECIRTARRRFKEESAWPDAPVDENVFAFPLPPSAPPAPVRGWAPVDAKWAEDHEKAVVRPLFGPDGKAPTLPAGVAQLRDERLFNLLRGAGIAKRQWLLTQAVNRYLARLAETPYDRLVLADMTRRQVAPTEAAKVIPYIRADPPVRVEAALTRPFKAEYEKYLDAVEKFSKEIRPGQMEAPVLDADLTAGKLVAGATDSRVKYRARYYAAWWELYGLLDKTLLAKIESDRIRTFGDLQSQMRDDFAVPNSESVCKQVHDLATMLNEGLSAEKDKAWLTAEQLKPLSDYHLPAWLGAYDKIADIYRRARNTLDSSVLKLKDDPVTGLKLLLDKPAELADIEGLEKLAGDYDNLRACRPFLAVRRIITKAEELLATDVNARFRTEWAPVEARARQLAAKFPFSARIDGNGDATLDEAREFLGSEAEVGKIMNRFAPLEVKAGAGFPFVWNPEERVKRFAGAWREWRKFAMDPDGKSIRRFADKEKIELIIEPKPDLVRNPDRLAAFATRLIIQIDNNETVVHDFTAGGRGPFAMPLSFEQKNTIRVMTDLENAAKANRPAVYPKFGKEAVASHWAILRYIADVEQGGYGTVRWLNDRKTAQVYHFLEINDRGAVRKCEVRLDFNFPEKVPIPFP